MKSTALLVGSIALAACASSSGNGGSRLITLRPELLAETRSQLHRGNDALQPALARLVSDAEAALALRPLSVVEKKRVPPSGDPHDYMSMGPYWWPDPTKPDGLPYIRRDGERNPEVQQDFDSPRMKRMSDAVIALSLAYYFTANEAYARHAATLLRTWFIEPATRMNPHLEYAQSIPGVSLGRGIGIIDTSGLPRLLDALSILNRSPSWPAADQQQMRSWLASFLEWLRTSRNGKDEFAAKNNHGSWYDAQTVALALFLDQPDLARQMLEQSKTHRIAAQIEPDGSQPHELERTRSLSYSVYNLRALMQLAEMGRKLDVDLWQYQAPSGGSLRKALDYLAPYADSSREWTARQITSVQSSELLEVLRLGEVAFGDERYRALQQHIPARVRQESRLQLFYPSPSPANARARQ